MPNSNNGDDQQQQRSPNLYASFMRATARDDAAALTELITQAKKEGALEDNLLRVSLQNCAKKGHPATARVLLENGAQTDIVPGGKGSPALFWAVSQPQNKGHQAVAKLLLSSKDVYPTCPADKNWRDENGRTLVQSAAWRNHHQALTLLLDAGAEINARDTEKQTVLHSLAADKKGKWDTDGRQKVVASILDRPIDTNLRDGRRRTALHWACATGKTDFVDKLIGRSRYQKPDLNIRTDRGKTALNLACSTTPPIPAIVEKLLKAGADPQITSDGGWTCLHVSAVIQNSVEIVELLLSYCPSLLNAKTSTTLTPLHCAAEAGSQDVVRHLLSKPDIKLNAKDAFHTTPLLRAAQQGHLSIVDLLAPYNNVDRLSHYALDACNGFEATVVDFRGVGSDHQNIVQKRSVFEVLYAKEKEGDHLVTTRVDKLKSRTRPDGGASDRAGASKPRFRWIHLPANNLAWVEALIAKAFIESDCSDLEGFKAVERSFSHQHRGPLTHSQYMTTLCQRGPRGGQSDKTPLFGALEDAMRTSAGRARHEYQSSPERTSRPQFKRPSRNTSSSTENEPDKAKWQPKPVEIPSVHDQMTRTGALRALTEEPESLPTFDRVNGESSVRSPKLAKSSPLSEKKAGKKKVKKGNAPPTQGGTDEEKTEHSSAATPKNPASRVNSFAAASDGPAPSKNNKKPWDGLVGSNMTLFMPYLHWETDERRQRMQRAIEDARAGPANAPAKRPTCNDEILIRAHLQSTLHLRRTLDQFFLSGIDTEARDADQVVYRYCLQYDRQPKVYMVDQLWMWILGPGLIITAFPQRWQQPKNDPLNVLDGIIEDVNSKIGSTVQSVYDLALLITARTSGSFDRHRPGDEDYQFLDMFESSIGNVANDETSLYRDFYGASKTVHEWLSTHREPSSEADYPKVVDRFLDIGAETKLLQEIKDIRDELGMIAMVLGNQKSTLPQLADAIAEDFKEARNHAKERDVKRKIEDQKRTVDTHLSDVDRMEKLAEKIELSLLNLLDLKQKQSNAFEARFARDQAAGTVRQGQIIMVFTMVTIIFLPMSFLAAFFTIPITNFPHHDNGQPLMHVTYVSKYIFGIGLAVSLVLIAVAFSINPLSAITIRMR